MESYSLQFFQSFFDGIVCDIVHLTFIVNGKQVYGGVSDLHMSDNPGATGFSFSLEMMARRILRQLLPSSVPVVVWKYLQFASGHVIDPMYRIQSKKQ